jgi:nitronate monooxygenase
MWPNNRILKLFGIELPIIQAPMASCVFSEMVVAVSEAGGLGSLPCALLSVEQMRSELGAIRRQTSRPIHVNFFCHTPPRGESGKDLETTLAALLRGVWARTEHARSERQPGVF